MITTNFSSSSTFSSYQWGKARADGPESNLTKKVNTLWNFAAAIGARGGKGSMVHGLRSLGSAALDMAYVATGAIDIFQESGCWEWDVGELIDSYCWLCSRFQDRSRHPSSFYIRFSIFFESERLHDFFYFFFGFF